MKKKFKDRIIFKELRNILPYYIIVAGLTLLACALICMFSENGSYTLYTGLLTGTVLSAANFLLMGISAEKSLYMSEKSAKTFATGTYSARYIMLFVIMGFLAFFKLINIVTAIIPLFVPKIAYTINAVFEKSEF